MAKKRLILGIDLGTTYSLVCTRVGDGQFHFFTPEPGGDQLIPSVFLHKENGEILVGAAAEAEEKFEEHRPHVVRHVKRYMNRNYQEGDQPPETFASHGKVFLPSEISGHILKTLKESAENEFRSKGGAVNREEFEWLGHIYDAVITVPAYFGPSERNATRDAAKFAGFSPENIYQLDEPVAAALSLNLHKQNGKRIVLVVDVGGGTTDITLLKVGKAVENGGFFELGRIGDAGLGGVDIDQRIVRKAIYSTIASKKQDRYSIDEKVALEDNSRQGPFFKRAEMEKKKVCREMREKKGVYGEVRYREPGKNELFEFKFNEEWLRSETEYFVKYCAQLCDFLLKNIDRREAGKWWPGHGISWNDVDEVWMVGGTSLMPNLQEQFIGRLRDPKKLHIAPRPQHAVAEGAAIYADMLARNQPLKGMETSRCPCDIGVMARPRVGGWQRLRRRLFFWEKAPKTPNAVFFPLIRSNTRLNDASHCTKEYQARVRPGADGKAYLHIYQRFVSRPPRESPQSETTQQASKDIQYKTIKLRHITIPNLTPTRDCTDIDTIFFQVTYEPTHTLRVTARFRGHELQAIEVREGEFNMLFKADTMK